MLALCAFYYHAFEEIFRNRNFSAREVYHMVEVADKYECTDEFYFQIAGLLETHFNHAPPADFASAVLRAAAAYLFTSAKLFKIATRDLMVKSNASFSATRKLEGGDVIPCRALRAMAERRSRAQRSLSSGLGEGNICGDCGSSSDDDIYRRKLLGALNVEGWPPFDGRPDDEYTLETCLTRLKEKRELTFDSTSCRHREGYGGRVDLFVEILGIENVGGGLCLECVRADCIAEGRGCEHPAVEN